MTQPHLSGFNIVGYSLEVNKDSYVQQLHRMKTTKGLYEMQYEVDSIEPRVGVATCFNIMLHNPVTRRLKYFPLFIMILTQLKYNYR